MSDKKLIDSSNFPAFDPYNFQIKNQTYGNTGGNCMVGTTEFRLPIAGASVWVNCSNEAVSVYSTDTIWNGDNSDTWGKEDDYLLFRADLDDKIPYAAKPWLKMIKEALAYTIEKETAYFNGTFSLPLDWLPSAIKDNVSTEYLDWLKKQDKNIIIGKDSVIVADDEYAGNVIREDKPFDEYYIPQWEERPDDDGFMFRPAKHLPIGWGWEEWNDGSGGLVSPEGKSIVSYDFSTKEYKIDGKWHFMDDAGLDKEYFEKLAYAKHVQPTQEQNKETIINRSDDAKGDFFVDRKEVFSELKNAEEAYAHAFQSCVDPKDDGYLRRLIADTPNIKEPFVAVRGFANYDFVIPLHEPMSFDEASEKFKEMNSNTVQFWIVHKPSEQADDLAIFPFYYDRTGQNNGEYHDLRSFIEMKLHNAQQELNASSGRYSGHAHTPDQEAIDRGYSALASVDAFNLSAENNLFATISNKEILGHAVDGTNKRIEKEQSIKAQLEAEGKPSPIADHRIAKYTEQLAELVNAKPSDIQNLKSISELNLLYYAVHAVEDNLYNEANPVVFSYKEIKAFMQQRDELSNRIIEIEKYPEKEHDNMSKYDISARVNPLKDQSKNVKAMASVTIDNVIAINDLTIVEGKNGAFVGYPQNKDKDGNFRDVVEFLRKDGKMTQEAVDLRDAINKTLLDMHKNGERATPDKAEQDKKPVDHEIKAFVTPLRESENATKGLATVQVGEMFKINSIRVNENTKDGSENFGKNFVAMPSRPDKSAESGYKDVVHPVTTEFGEKLKGAVLKQYDNQLAWKENAAKKEQSVQQHDKPPANKNAPDNR